MMKIEFGLAVSIAALLSGCGDAPQPPANRADVERPSPPASPVTETAPRIIEQRAKPLIGEAIVLAEWRKADNRGACAPLALRSDGGAGGTPRPATFSGGWAVAFDQPGLRSAYGVAGAGLLPEDRDNFAVKVNRLARQWPLVRRWDAGANLPAGSAAGYGLEGAEPYPEGSQEVGRQSLAYLRIRGQQCQYNVWSKLGRDHLELLLGQLEMIARRAS